MGDKTKITTKIIKKRRTMKMKNNRLVLSLLPLILLICGNVLAYDLTEETLGAIKFVEANKAKVVTIYGNPDNKKEESCKACPEDHHECKLWGKYEYKSKGLRFSVCDNGVMSIEAFEKSVAKTSKGIGLGNTKGEVEKVYGKLLKEKNDTYQVPETTGNPIKLEIEFANNKASRIKLSRTWLNEHED